MREDNDAKNEIVLSGLLQAEKNGIPADKSYVKWLASYKDNSNQNVVKNGFGENQIVGGLNARLCKKYWSDPKIHNAWRA